MPHLITFVVGITVGLVWSREADRIAHEIDKDDIPDSLFEKYFGEIKDDLKGSIQKRRVTWADS